MFTEVRRRSFWERGLLGRGWDIKVIIISSDEQGDESIMSVTRAVSSKHYRARRTKSIKRGSRG